MNVTSGYHQKRNHETITKYAGEENNESPTMNNMCYVMYYRDYSTHNVHYNYLPEIDLGLWCFTPLSNNVSVISSVSLVEET
jgi:hypothetical protein